MTSYNSPFSGDVVQPTDVSYVSYTLTTDLTLVWPVNGNVGDVAARIMQIDALLSGLSVYMPPADQVSVGQDALISNTGSVSYDVLDSAGGTITAVAPGESKYIYITDNSTASGIWTVVDFGATTGAPSAAMLAGYGLLAISNTLNQAHPASGVSDGYTFLDSDRAQAKVWSSGTGEVFLPSASTIGNNYFFLFKNNSSGTVAVTCTGVETIDGVNSKNFQPNESAMIISTGSEFITVGYGAGTNFYFTALVKSVTTGTYTLTAQEGQSIIDEYIGSLTGDVTIVYPPVVALYAITNQVTPNGHTLSVTTGLSGSNSVIIPAGESATLICDGTNFFNANTIQAGATTVQLTSGSVTNPSLSFALETNTGMYRPGVGQIGFTVLGTEIFEVGASGVDVTGDATVAGVMTADSYVNIAGGTF